MKRLLKFIITLLILASIIFILFKVVKIDDIIYGKGIAHSKKEAEQEAAKSALEKSIGTN